MQIPRESLLELGSEIRQRVGGAGGGRLEVFKEETSAGDTGLDLEGQREKKRRSPLSLHPSHQLPFLKVFH
jgi:hypothetical protein